MRGKKVLEGVWLGRGEEKKGRAQVFSSWAHQKVFFPGPPESFLPRPTRKFSSQNGEKLLESLIY